MTTSSQPPEAGTPATTTSSPSSRPVSAGATSQGGDWTPPTDVNPWIIAVAVMFATLMVFVDTTVVNLALPYMAGSLSASVNEATWALTSYLAANAIILPITGWLANHVGRKRLLLASVSSFTFTSLLCGLAPNIELLVLFRVLQGLTGGVMQPISQSILLESFPPRDRGKAMGFWSLGIISAPIIGPLLGGWLTQAYSWRWVFFINIPIGIVALVMVQVFIFDPSYIRRLHDKVDYRGIVLLALSIGALQVLLDRGQDEDWLDSRLIWGLLIVGVAAGLVFVFRSLSIDHPVADLTIFRDRTFAVGSLLSALIGFLLYASIVVLPLLLQTLLGYPPLDAGMVVVARAIGSLIAFPVVGVLATRYDARRLLVLGLVLGAITMFWFARFDLDLSAWDLFWPQFFQGIALGLLFIPLTTITMSTVSNEKMGNASSLFNVTRNFGSSIGIAVVATALERGRIRHGALLGDHVSDLDPLTRLRLEQLESAFAGRGSDAATAAEQARAALAATVERQAGILAFLDTFRLLGWIFVAMIPLAFLMRRPEHD